VTDRKVFPQTSVTPDTELYTVSDLSTVWADADVYEYEVPFVHLGQRVSLSMSYYPGKTYTGDISYIYPTVDSQTRTVKVRIQIPNPGFASQAADVCRRSIARRLWDEDYRATGGGPQLGYGTACVRRSRWRPV